MLDGDGWVGLGCLGCLSVGYACSEGEYGYEACGEFQQVVSFRLSDI